MTQGAAETWLWHWDGAAIEVGVTRAGQGPTLLLLPALSSISTRREMAPLQARLAAHYATIAVDWPGFGDRPRPRVDWRPEAYRAFLDYVLANLVQRPHASVSVGHGAATLIGVAGQAPGIAGRLCLVAPTWRGPLPTMMGRKSALGANLVRAGDWPGIGALLYRLNVNDAMVGMMARGHVYEDRDWLTPARMAEKRAVTAARGARYASIRFVTGLLDPFESRETFLNAVRAVTGPILLIKGAHSPRRSLAEMAALAAEPNVESVTLPHGKLGIHEEYPDAVADAIVSFCGQPAKGKSF